MFELKLWVEYFSTKNILFTALVGFYNEKMSASDVNCILDEVKVRPTPKPTTSPVTRSTTAKPTPKPTTSKQTPKTTTTKQTPKPTTTKQTPKTTTTKQTPKPTTTKQTPKPTTTEKPETNPTSTTKQPVVPDGCESKSIFLFSMFNHLKSYQLSYPL